MSKLARDDEELLISRSQQGDVSAFNLLVLHYQQTLYGAVFRILGNAESAADVTQEAFFSAFRGIRSYRGGSSFRSWLLRIGTNAAYDHWRRVQRHPAESLEMLTEEDSSHTQHSLSTLNALVQTGAEVNPEEYLLTQELQDCIQRGLEQLPFDQRTALVLCDIEGFSYEEVAAVTEATLGTVRSRISRGRARMRDYLSKHKELLPRHYRLT